MRSHKTHMNLLHVQIAGSLASSFLIFSNYSTPVGFTIIKIEDDMWQKSLKHKVKYSGRVWWWWCAVAAQAAIIIGPDDAVMREVRCVGNLNYLGRCMCVYFYDGYLGNICRSSHLVLRLFDICAHWQKDIVTFTSTADTSASHQSNLISHSASGSYAL